MILDNATVLTCADIKTILPARPQNSHKGTYGKVVIIGGSDGMPGAVTLAAEAAYRAGCGLVCVCTTQKAAMAAVTRRPEVITEILPSDNGFISSSGAEGVIRQIEGASAVLVGPGMGCEHNTRVIARTVLQAAKCPVVLDADALNTLDLQLLKQSKLEVIVTPHPKEMSRLNGQSVDVVSLAPIKTAVDFAQEYNAVTLLKGNTTIIAAPDSRIIVNKTGTSALAKAGTGDVLAGVVVSFAAQGLNLYHAACAAAFIHGKAGVWAAREYGECGVLASDVCAAVAKVIKDIRE